MWANTYNKKIFFFFLMSYWVIVFHSKETFADLKQENQMARCLFYELQTHAGVEDGMEQDVP